MRRFFYAIDGEQQSNIAERPALHTFKVGEDIALTENITHHWCRVLRANLGDNGILFDGFGGEYQVQLSAISKKQASVTLVAPHDNDRSAPIISKMGLVMSRGDRMDYAIQKATELGVTAIQLLSSHHGEVSLKPAQVDKKLAHWQQIAISACEQCGLNRPPLILAPLTITQWLEAMAQKTAELMTAVSPIMHSLSQDAYYQRLHQDPELRLVMSVPTAGDPLMPVTLMPVLAQEMPYIELLIGPEGGLSDDEITQAQNAGFVTWQIGNRVLRTETAPVVALATLYALSLRLS